MKKSILFLFSILYFLPIAQAQDPNISHPIFSPLFLNPALTGVMEGNHRLNLKYRNQWQSVLKSFAYETAMLSYDFRKCNRRDFWGYGISFLGDRAGISPYQHFQTNLNIAYHRRFLSRTTFLSFGFQAGILNYQFDLSKLRFDAQFDGFDFNKDLPHQESFANESRYLLDLGAGLLIFDTDLKYTLGLGLIHANQPQFRFKDAPNETESRVNMRMVLHGSMPYQFRGGHLMFRLLLMSQRPVNEWQHWQLQPSVEPYFDLSKTDFHAAFSFGVGARLTDNNAPEKGVQFDAFIFKGRLELGQLTLGASYDLNISGLTVISTGRGGFELSLGYQFVHPKNVNRDCIDCPNF